MGFNAIGHISHLHLGDKNRSVVFFFHSICMHIKFVFDVHIMIFCCMKER